MTDIQSAATMPQFIRAIAAAYGDATAVTLAVEGKPDETISFVELERRSAELGRALVARGVGKGARVGFLIGNGPDFAVAFIAASRIGAIAIPISTMIRANELIRVLRQSDVLGLIVQRSLLGHDMAERLCDALPALRTSGPELRLPETPYLRWVVSTGDDLPAAFGTVDALLADAAKVDEALLAEIEREVHTTDQLVEIYTSGSMALPKGVRHNHGPIFFRTHYLSRMLGFEHGTPSAAIMPMFWIGGIMMYLLPPLAAGSVVVCSERTLNNSRVAMGSVLADEDLKLMGSAKVFWGLGMSETIGPYSWGDELRAPGRPVCAPMDHFADRYDVRIVDEAGREIADGEIGEIQIRGYPVTPGLHKIERDEHFTPDGFYRTGDLATREGSRVHFVGRSGDMIKTAGSNVSPAEVEMEMQALETIHNAYVVGIPDAERGQLVVAAVVPREGATLDFTAIEGELRKRLSSYKVPRAYFQISREEVPMLPSNKVARRVIADMARQHLGRA